MMTTTCPTCKEPIRIAPSKRVQVCKNCLSIARTGKSIKEIAREKHREWSERSRLKSRAKQAEKPKKSYTIKSRSVNGAKREREIAKVKHDLTRAALDGDHIQCRGCLNYFDTIDRSHIVPVSQSSALASDPNNITLLCRACHQKYENGSVPEMIELKCLVRDLRFMFEHDNSRFWKIFYRLRDEWTLRPTPKLSAVLDKLEKFDT